MGLSWRKYFLVAALICFTLQIVGAALSIGMALPAQATMGNVALSPTEASPMLVLKDFFTHGTALAPPLLLMTLFGLLCLIARLKGKPGVAGTLLLIILSLLFTFATLGEYANPDRFANMPGPVYLAMLILNQASIAAVILLGIAAIAVRRVRKSSVNF